jgi:hypothetical protein
MGDSPNSWRSALSPRALFGWDYGSTRRAGVIRTRMIRTARGDQFGLAHPRGVFVRGQTRYIAAVIRVVDYSGAGVGAALSL